MTSLDLASNTISTIGYLNMPFLEHLDLSNNAIVLIEKLNLPVIKTLLLNSNQLKSLTALYNLQSLQLLEIIGNEEITAAEIIAFKKHVNCEVRHRISESYQRGGNEGYQTPWISIIR